MYSSHTHLEILIICLLYIISPYHIGPRDIGSWSLEQPLISSLPGHTRLISIDVHQCLQVEAVVSLDQGEGLDGTTIVCGRIQCVRMIILCVCVCVCVCMCVKPYMCAVQD